MAQIKNPLKRGFFICARSLCGLVGKVFVSFQAAGADLDATTGRKLCPLEINLTAYFASRIILSCTSAV